jgi:hypothetical protein
MMKKGPKRDEILQEISRKNSTVESLGIMSSGVGSDN